MKFLVAVLFTLPFGQVLSSIPCRLKKNPNSDCGRVGKIKYEDRQYYDTCSPQIVKSVIECANLCSRRRNRPPVLDPYDGYSYRAGRCASFEYFQYDKDTIICQLGGSKVNDTIIPQRNSRKSYYDIDCFDCGGICEQSYGQNLVDNAGFEEPLLGPWATEGGGVVHRRNSSHVFFCPKGRACTLSQVVNLCYASTYAFEFDFFLPPEKNVSYRSLSLQFLGRSEYDIKALPSKNPEWRTFRGVFTHNANVIGFIFLAETSSGAELMIDNFTITHVPALPPAAGPEMIENGDFETGTLSPWKKTSPKIKLISPGIGRSKYAVFYPTNIDGRIYQRVKTVPHTLYLLSYTVFPSPNAPDQDFYCYTSAEMNNISPGVFIDFTKPMFPRGRTTVSDYVYITTKEVELALFATCSLANLTVDDFKLVRVKSDAFSYLK